MMLLNFTVFHIPVDSKNPAALFQLDSHSSIIEALIFSISHSFHYTQSFHDSFHEVQKGP